MKKHLKAGTIEPGFATPERPSKLDPFAPQLRAALFQPSIQRGQIGKVRHREPKANVERYDGLRSQFAGGRHAS